MGELHCPGCNGNLYDEYLEATEDDKPCPGLPTLPEEVREPTESPLQHGMNCPALILGADQDECQCGLKWRIRLRTEQEMHAAWRKRAEEAEAQLAPTDDRLSRALKLLEESSPNFGGTTHSVIERLRKWNEERDALLGESGVRE